MSAASSPTILGRQERIVRGRMPTMELINERFARYLRIGLFNYMHKGVEVSVAPIKVQKYSEFIRNLVVPTNLNLIQAKPLRGTGLIVMDPNLVFLVVDNMFGGDGRFPYPRRRPRLHTHRAAHHPEPARGHFRGVPEGLAACVSADLRIRALRDEHPVRQHRDTLRKW
jgi:hypothetical protein